MGTQIGTAGIEFKEEFRPMRKPVPASPMEVTWVSRVNPDDAMADWARPMQTISYDQYTLQVSGCLIPAMGVRHMLSSIGVYSTIAKEGAIAMSNLYQFTLVIDDVDVSQLLVIKALIVGMHLAYMR